MNIFCCLILLMISMGHVSAKSFGVVGEVFPIAEKSFLTLIEERLASLKASGELESLNQRWVQTAAEHANRPTALDIARTNHSARHNYVPEMTLSQDITNEKGRILYSKGTGCCARLMSLCGHRNPALIYFAPKLFPSTRRMSQGSQA